MQCRCMVAGQCSTQPSKSNERHMFSVGGRPHSPTSLLIPESLVVISGNSSKMVYKSILSDKFWTNMNEKFLGY